MRCRNCFSFPAWLAEFCGGKAIVFNTITISDGISMGSEGMKYSLVSREVIADSIETVVGCGGMDGFSFSALGRRWAAGRMRCGALTIRIAPAMLNSLAAMN